MTELKRWLDDSPPDEVVALLDSAQKERPPVRVLEQTLVALGTTSAAATAAATGTAVGASKLAGASMLGILVKWGGTGVISGCIVAGALAGVEHLQAGKARSAAANVAPVNALPSVPPAVTAPRGGETLQPVPELPAQPEATKAASGAPPALPATATPSAELVAEAVAAEIETVDAARARLRSGDTGAALRLLADYETRFTSPHFTPEVLYLRMESFRRGGDLGSARSIAQRITSRFPGSPQVGLAEEVLKAADAAAAPKTE